MNRHVWTSMWVEGLVKGKNIPEDDTNMGDFNILGADWETKWY